MKVIRSYVYRIYLSHNQIDKFENLFNKNVLLFNIILNNYKNNIKPKLNDIIENNEELKNGNLNSFLNTYIKTCQKFCKFDCHKIHKKISNFFPKKIHFKMLQNMTPVINNNHISIPHIGNFRIKYHRPLPVNSHFLHFLIEERTCNEFYINFTIEIEVSSNKIQLKKSVGLDYSSPHLFHSSDNELGDKYIVRNFEEDKISNLKRRMSKCVLNSKNYLKLRNKQIKLYSKVAEKRKYFLNKASNDLLNNYDIIGIETLSLSEIAKRKNLGKHTYENAYRKFCKLLEYKAEILGKKIVKVPKYFPSSKTCSRCGKINHSLSLNDREFICECGLKLNRDLNAAINIKNRALINL